MGNEKQRSIELDELFINPNDALQGHVDYLVSQLAMLSDEQQDFVLGCQMTLAGAAPITPENVVRLKRISQQLSHANHATVSAEGALTVGKMLQDLARAVHTLTPQEKAFANQIYGKNQAKHQITQQEMLALVNLYGSKGF